LMSTAGSLVTMRPTGTILGPFEDSWREVEVELAPESILTIYSDGLIEAKGSDGNQFGLDRLVQVMGDASQSGDPDLVADACLSAVVPLGRVRMDDDVTLVVISCQSGPDQDLCASEHLSWNLQAESVGH
ncbi:MAG: PP2C family protein-serine/threonine phosphatase, partial [Pseudonocardiaceae bacterium]